MDESEHLVLKWKENNLLVMGKDKTDDWVLPWLENVEVVDIWQRWFGGSYWWKDQKKRICYCLGGWE